jgi:hypothetical protein
MNTIFKIILIIALFFAQGCAHSDANRRLDAKLSSASQTVNRNDLSKKTRQRIEDPNSISPDQKIQLLSLEKITHQQMDGFTQQSLQLRSLLVQDLTSTPYNESEVALIKMRIQKIENRRVSTIFRAADEANVILGRQAVGDREVLDDVINLISDGPYSS